MSVNTIEGQGERLIEEVRAQISEVSTGSVLAFCLDHLRQPPTDGIDWYQRIPFVPLLIMKWAAELWSPDEQRRQIDQHDYALMCQKVWDANGDLFRPGHVSIFMRRMAFQQIWYQHNFDKGSIPRQAVIFGDFMRDAPVVRDFVEREGIEPRDFARQLAVMAAQMGELIGIAGLEELRPQPRPTDAAHWGIVTPHFQTDLPAMHARMVDLARYATPRGVELCEQSPLIPTPFLHTRNGFECIHHKLLFRSLETRLYDILRGTGAERFMREFGPAFERYVGAVLEELGLRLIEERTLQGMLVGQGKCVDFALVDEDILVLVDSKGIEGHYDELYHSLPEVLTSKLRTTALHAADQAIGTFRRLPEELQRPMTVFLCVTYKQLNIGDGDALRALTVNTPDWDSARWHEAGLPPSQMFTISIQELELLVGIVRAGGRLSEIFRQILANNASPETSKLLFQQHLARYGQVEIPRFSRLAAHRLCGI